MKTTQNPDIIFKGHYKKYLLYSLFTNCYLLVQTRSILSQTFSYLVSMNSKSDSFSILFCFGITSYAVILTHENIHIRGHSFNLLQSNLRFAKRKNIRIFFNFKHIKRLKEIIPFS